MIAQDASYWPADAGYDSSITCLDVRRLPDVAVALQDTGFNDNEIAGILGGNFRRVAEQVWK